jgi:hypothetical protein
MRFISETKGKELEEMPEGIGAGAVVPRH